MGLIASIRHRVAYVWYWRVRYWWMDTRGGTYARVSLYVGCSVVAVVMSTLAAIDLSRPASATHPREGFVFLVVLLISLLIGVLLAVLAPKPKPPDTTSQNTGPTTQDGQAVLDVFGTVWIDDTFLLAWKIVGTEAIKSKGGKK